MFISSDLEERLLCNKNMYFILAVGSAAGLFQENSANAIAAITMLSLNNITYHYVARHARAVKPLKSRYGDDMVISEEDAARAVSYDGYTVQGYRYLNYYCWLIDLFFIGWRLFT